MILWNRLTVRLLLCMTNVVVAAYAVGDIDNLKDSFNSALKADQNTILSFIISQKSLVREDMKPTFEYPEYK